MSDYLYQEAKGAEDDLKGQFATKYVDDEIVQIYEITNVVIFGMVHMDSVFSRARYPKNLKFKRHSVVLDDDFHECSLSFKDPDTGAIWRITHNRPRLGNRVFVDA